MDTCSNLGGTGQAPNPQQLWGQVKRPIDKKSGEQAKRPIDKKLQLWEHSSACAILIR
ncbi:MAG: hypothetical protein RBU37_23230 [Myxococcota bacterium]|nr:hypothetical protein [Myxococcota bacterium]